MSFPRSLIPRPSLLVCWSLWLLACSGEDFSAPAVLANAGASGSAGNSGRSGQAGQAGGSVQGGGAGSGQGGSSGGSGQGGATAGSSAGGQAGQGGMAGTMAGGKAGAAGQGECAVGQFKCQGDNLLVCSLKGQKFELLETCNPGKCKVEMGACVDDCKTDEVRCLGDELQSCQMGSFKKKETCAKGLCSQTQKKCLSCEEGEIKACAGSGVAQLACDDQGVPSKEVSCPPETKFCVGDGQCVECRVDSDCPASTEDCRDAACINDSCALAPLAAGQPAKNQVEGDCTRKLCDGSGGVMLENLDVGQPCSSDGAGEGVCNGKGKCGVCKPGKWECVSGGAFHLCNEQGQWDLSITCPSSKPACEVSECIGVNRVAMGEHSACAIMSNGTVRCWGSDTSGLLAQGKDTLIAPRPVRVTGLANIASMAIGEYHACALDQQSRAYCWGDNASGQVGINSKEGVFFSPQLIETRTFSSLVAGFDHTCGVEGKSLWCWGENKAGQVSPQMSSPVSSPAVVASVKDGVDPAKFYLTGDVQLLSAGSYHTCILTSAKKVICWGLNDKHQIRFLGTGVSATHRASEVLFKDWDPATIQVLLSRGSTNGVVMNTGSLEVLGWGLVDNADQYSTDYINAGPYTNSSVFSVTNEVRVSSNGDYLAVTGLNNFGQLGTGSKQSGNSVATAKHAIKGIAGSATNGRTVCVWENGGRVLCWGDNTDNLTGTDSFDATILTPTEVKW